jgi:hypothetical protein
MLSAERPASPRLSRLSVLPAFGLSSSRPGGLALKEELTAPLDHLGPL